MTTLLDNAIKQSDLLNRLIIDFNSTEKIGRVKQLWLDAREHQILGLTCAGGLLNRDKHSFHWNKIQTIGKDSIMIDLQEEEVEQPNFIDTVIGLEIWTDGGEQVGKVIDYFIDRQTGAVVAYLFTARGWTSISDGTYSITPEAFLSIGQERVIVAQSGIANAQQYEPGLSGKIQHAKEYLQEDLAQSQADFSVAVEKTQGLTAQLKEKAQQTTEVAKEKLSDAAGQIKRTTQDVAQQTQERLTEFKTKNAEVEDSATEDEDRSLASHLDRELEPEETSYI